jgi:hypothetical protein
VLPGCKYPEVPVFARGVSEGMGAWVSSGGTIDCRSVFFVLHWGARVSDVLYRLAALPGGENATLDENGPPPSVAHVMAMVPGMMNGKYYTMTVLVQNRTPKNTPMGQFSRLAS